jgi:hypothetical protein
MDPGAFYRKDQAAFFLGWEIEKHSLVLEARPCSATEILHFSVSLSRSRELFIALTISQSPEKIEVKHEEVTDENAVQWASRSFDSEIDASARIL